jgi:hypothetical protein
LIPAATLARRRWIANSLLAATILLCGILVAYPPGRFAFYPTCPVHEYLHIDCPGCGATRALSALLRGQLAEALRLNALFVLLLPLGLAAVLDCYRRAVRAGEFRWPAVPSQALYATLAATVIFTIARNIS